MSLFTNGLRRLRQVEQNSRSLQFNLAARAGPAGGRRCAAEGYYLLAVALAHVTGNTASSVAASDNIIGPYKLT